MVFRLLRRWVKTSAIATVAIALIMNHAAASFAGGSVSADATEASPGDTVTFTATTSFIPGGEDSASASFSATMPPVYTNVSWTCSGTNAICSSASGTGASLDVSASVEDASQPASVAVVITATVTGDAPSGKVVTQVCIGSGSGGLYAGNLRALPHLQEGSATVTIVPPNPTSTPTEPAATAPVTEFPATPIATQTEISALVTPTPGSGSVTQLPRTGAGENDSHRDLVAVIGALALTLVMSVAVVSTGRRLHKRS